MFSLYVYGEPLEFSIKFGPILKNGIEEDSPQKLSKYSRTFAKGVSRFMARDISLSFTDKHQERKILQTLDEIVETFDKTIERSIKRIKK